VKNDNSDGDDFFDSFLNIAVNFFAGITLNSLICIFTEGVNDDDDGFAADTDGDVASTTAA
jgi:hypothetical protein